jgi:hypothetical protein
VVDVEWLGILAGGFGLFVAVKIAIVVLAGLVFPLFWIWMLVDAVLRREADYPNGTSDVKLLWILLLLFVHVSSVVYLFMVFRKARTSAVSPVAPGYTVA